MRLKEDQPHENVQTQRRIASTKVQARMSFEHLETRKKTSLVGAPLTNGGYEARGAGRDQTV